MNNALFLTITLNNVDIQKNRHLVTSDRNQENGKGITYLNLIDIYGQNGKVKKKLIFWIVK